MNRDLVKALLPAWELPEFRAALRELIDLDEVTMLLAALADETHDAEVERRTLDLLRSALDTPEIRRAVLLLIESDDVRHHLSSVVVGALAHRPGLARAIASALEDPAVRHHLHAALGSPRVRDLVWQAVVNQSGVRRLALARQVVFLVIRHSSVRRLAWALQRHGVLTQLRRP